MSMALYGAWRILRPVLGRLLVSSGWGTSMLPTRARDTRHFWASALLLCTALGCQTAERVDIVEQASEDTPVEARYREPVLGKGYGPERPPPTGVRVEPKVGLSLKQGVAPARASAVAAPAETAVDEVGYSVAPGAGVESVGAVPGQALSSKHHAGVSSMVLGSGVRAGSMGSGQQMEGTSAGKIADRKGAGIVTRTTGAVWSSQRLSAPSQVEYLRPGARASESASRTSVARQPVGILEGAGSTASQESQSAVHTQADVLEAGSDSQKVAAPGMVKRTRAGVEAEMSAALSAGGAIQSSRILETTASVSSISDTPAYVMTEEAGTTVYFKPLAAGGARSEYEVVRLPAPSATSTVAAGRQAQVRTRAEAAHTQSHAWEAERTRAELLPLGQKQELYPGGKVGATTPATRRLEQSAAVATRETSGQPQMLAQAAEVELRAERPDIRLRKWSDKPSAVPGETITFTIGYENIGNSPALDVFIEDMLSPGITYLAGTAGGKNAHVKVSQTLSGRTYIIWRLTRPVLPGQCGEVYFKARVN